LVEPLVAVQNHIYRGFLGLFKLKDFSKSLASLKQDYVHEVHTFASSVKSSFAFIVLAGLSLFWLEPVSVRTAIG
jgi:hypothetical protein